MKNPLLLSIICSSLLLTSCASMIDGTTQQITVNSEVRGSKIYVNDEYIGTDSASIKLSKKKLSETVLKVKKEGCTDSSRDIDTKINGTSFLGCFLDLCVVSVLVVDTLITGAIREAERTSYVLNPKCDNK